MTLQELFTSQMDFASLSALARQGLAWWLDELAAMLPAGWRDRLSSRPRVWIERRAQGGWSVWRDGRRIEADAPSIAARTRIGLLAPPQTVLLRELSVPRMPAADVRRMLTLDIDRLSPLNPELIHFDMEIADRDETEGVQRVVVGLITREDAALLVSDARSEGYAPAMLSTRIAADEAASPRFDFLPQVARAAGEPGPDRTGLYWWAAAAALILVNIAVLVGRDMADVSTLQASVDAQQPIVNVVARLRQRVRDEDARRADLIARGQRGDPLRMLNALTEAVPQGAWVQHLEWNGQALRIIGFRRDDIDMASAIRGSGAFTNPRTLTAEPTAGPTQLRGFDMAADARSGARP